MGRFACAIPTDSEGKPPIVRRDIAEAFANTPSKQNVTTKSEPLHWDGGGVVSSSK